MNIIKYFGCVPVREGWMGLIMELVPGKNLSELVMRFGALASCQSWLFNYTDQVEESNDIARRKRDVTIPRLADC